MGKRKSVMAEWKEFNSASDRSMKDDFGGKPSPFSKEIVDYLDNGELVLASPSIAVDVFSGERIGKTNGVLTDGEFSWSSSLSYYVEKYNLQIPKELERKILSAMK